MGYVGRFAPSPTGPLHYGSLVAALASYLDARHASGKWLLRIEDLDPPRESLSAPGEIMRQLDAYKLKWDGDVLFQSTRLPDYEDALTRLASMGLTFACDCPRKSLPAVYPGHCRQAAKAYVEGGTAIRLRVPAESMIMDDRVFGRQAWDLDADVGDFIIRRRDGLFAYQLAVVVDDDYQDVTHIVRGADLLDSTPKQLTLYAALSMKTPAYLHIPIVTGPDGSKLSKQAYAPALDELKPADSLHQALSHLGQVPHHGIDNIGDLLERAITAWDVSRIPRQMQISAGTAI